MLACLMAAMMSSADTYMLVTSALVTRNLYGAYITPEASEKQALRVARTTGLIIIAGAVTVSLVVGDVFGQFKLAIELPILFAAPFWIACSGAAPTAPQSGSPSAFPLLVFFVLPYLLPALSPGMRTDPAYGATTHVVTKTVTRPATEADVAKREAWTEAVRQVNEKRDAALAAGDAAFAEKLGGTLKAIGAAPPGAAVGEPIQVVTKSGAARSFGKAASRRRAAASPGSKSSKQNRAMAWSPR